MREGYVRKSKEEGQHPPAAAGGAHDRWRMGCLQRAVLAFTLLCAGGGRCSYRSHGGNSVRPVASQTLAPVSTHRSVDRTRGGQEGMCMCVLLLE